ncbi:MAG: hypothetical protein LBV12_09595 [Puniceicoccales bacterium]|jgi:hypothetical protein|nr:hypothetical protein [Puniceicoccales bacterium]
MLFRPVVPFLFFGATLIACACGSHYYISSLLNEGDIAVKQKPRLFTSVGPFAPASEHRAVNPTSYDGVTESAIAGIRLLHEELFLKSTPVDRDRMEFALQQYVRKRKQLLCDNKKQRFGGVPQHPVYDYHKMGQFTLHQIGSKEFHVYWNVERDRGGNSGNTAVKPPETENPEIIIPDEIPAEFSLYLAGVEAWQKGEITSACELWKKILELPAEEKRNQEIFAIYMLGVAAFKQGAKELKGFTPAAKFYREACTYFQQVRVRAKETGIDPCGLAVASMGEEARSWLRCGPSVENFSKAAHLYWEQYASGDSNAVLSLDAIAYMMAKMHDSWMQDAAKIPLLRSLLTARFLAGEDDWAIGKAFWRDADVKRWIAALEESGNASDTEATQLAMLCYQQGEYISCARWLRAVPDDNLVGCWLMARLLLREGKTFEAEALLAKVSQTQSLKNKAEKNTLYNSLDAMEFLPLSWRTRFNGALIFSSASPARSVAWRMVGEHAVLALGKQDYETALDSFFATGLYEDSFYVAEYVMSTAELKNYVDARYRNEDGSLRTGGWATEALAKRLMRERRWQEARDYFWEGSQEILDRYSAAMQQAFNMELSAEKRAEGFWKAAVVVRKEGDKLFSASAGPTWVHPMWKGDNSGWQQEQVPQPARKYRFDEKPLLTKASHNETLRVKSRDIRREDRDARYRAAELAGYAANLLPNENPRTARILAAIGAWLRYRNARDAEPYYKQLVIRCSTTPIGKKASELHWFPKEIADTTEGVWEEPLPAESEVINDIEKK